MVTMAYRQSHWMPGKLLERYPKPKASTVVSVVNEMLHPTSVMVCRIRSSMESWGLVRRKLPVIMNVSSKPLPKITKGSIWWTMVYGTPHQNKIPKAVMILHMMVIILATPNLTREWVGSFR